MIDSVESAGPGVHRIRVQVGASPPITEPFHRPSPPRVNYPPDAGAQGPPVHEHEWPAYLEAVEKWSAEAERWVNELRRWTVANFPRPPREPWRLSYAAPDDEFGPVAEVNADGWALLASADGRSVRLCLDISDADEDGEITFVVQPRIQRLANPEPQPVAS